MKLKYYLFVILISVISWSCGVDSGSNNGEEVIYFPLKEFVEVNAEKLQGKSLIKEVNVNGQKENFTVTPSDEEWLKELDFFIQTDINRPSLANAYETQKSERYLIHSLKEGEKGKVKKIVVEYFEGNVKLISFQTKSENPFYSSQTRGVLSMHGVTGLIDSFSVETFQEVIFSKPNRMVVTGHVK